MGQTVSAGARSCRRESIGIDCPSVPLLGRFVGRNARAKERKGKLGLSGSGF